MTWIVGIDEAGYGPNLGPLVMSAVSCRVPDDLGEADLWDVLRPAVRRHTDDDDGRLLVDDSKLVYTNGLGSLEIGVLAALGLRANNLAAYLDSLCPDSHPALRGECWYTGQTTLPVAADPAASAMLACRLADCGPLSWAPARSVVVCAQHFNGLVDRWGSKGAVLGHCLGDLLQAILATDGDEPILLTIDKHRAEISTARCCKSD
jgi:hypothetical protein